LMGIWKIASGGVFSSASATNLCSASASPVFLCGKGETASEMPEHRGGVHVRVGLRRFQNFVPLVKAHFNGSGTVMKPSRSGISFTCGPTLAASICAPRRDSR